MAVPGMPGAGEEQAAGVPGALRSLSFPESQSATPGHAGRRGLGRRNHARSGFRPGRGEQRRRGGSDGSRAGAVPGGRIPQQGGDGEHSL